MSRPPFLVPVSVLAALLLDGAAFAGDPGAGVPTGLFQPVATFDVTLNGNEVAEIVASANGGNLLVYTDSSVTVDLTGLADFAPEDPEPEFVSINRRNEAVVSLQENNWFAVVDLLSGTVLADYTAGEVELTQIDAVEDALGPQLRGLIEVTDTIVRRREPDAVARLGDHRFVSANEGDYVDANGVIGGSRGFTIFDAASGTVDWDSGSSYEHEVVRIGHYPEFRSADKGSEVESVARARFGGRVLLFLRLGEWTTLQ